MNVITQIFFDEENFKFFTQNDWGFDLDNIFKHLWLIPKPLCRYDLWYVWVCTHVMFEIFHNWNSKIENQFSIVKKQFIFYNDNWHYKAYLIFKKFPPIRKYQTFTTTVYCVFYSTMKRQKIKDFQIHISDYKQWQQELRDSKNTGSLLGNSKLFILIHNISCGCTFNMVWTL